jgi:hypothetical protein
MPGIGLYISTPLLVYGNEWIYDLNELGNS